MNGNSIEPARLSSRGLRPATSPATQAPDSATRSSLATETLAPTALSATIAAELAEVVFGGPHYTVLFTLAVLLFMVTFGINFVRDQAIARMKRRMGVAQ